MKGVNEKRLEGIEPFNRFSFRSCMVHQLITAYGRYGVGEELFLMERFPVYRFEGGAPAAGSIELISPAESETLTGIRQIRREGCACLTDYLVRAIGRGDPVLVGVDCFFLPYREDAWQKDHLSHYLLAYGYDRRAETFLVNEHLFRSSYRYSELRIPFARLAEAHLGFGRTLRRRGGAGLIRVHRLRQTAFEPASADFPRRLKAKSSAFEASLARLNEIVGYIRASVQDEAVFWTRLDGLTDYIRLVKDQKNVQRYQMKLFGIPEAERLTEQIMDHFHFIYCLLGKMSIKGAWQSGSAVKICERAEEIMRLEHLLTGLISGEEK